MTTTVVVNQKERREADCNPSYMNSTNSTSFLVGRKDAYLFVKPLTLALCRDSIEVVEGGMDQAAFEGVHRWQQLAAVCAPYELSVLESHADDLLLMTHPVVLCVYDDLVL